MKNTNKQNKNATKDREAVALPPVPEVEASPIAQSSALESLKSAPLHKAKKGRVQLAVWMREDKNGTVRFSIQLGRSYLTPEGFKNASSLDQGDIANAIALLTEVQDSLPPMPPIAAS